MDYTSGLTTAPIYREWSAIGAVASALGRRVWWQANSDSPPIYPNMYILAVGEPGTGKSQAIDTAELLLRKVKGVRIAPDTITREQLWRRMAEAMEPIGEDTVPLIQSALCVVNSEIGNFIPRQDTVFMRALARLYDCPPIYHYDTKHQSGDDHMKDFIDNPCLNLLGGVQPVWMREALPKEAFEVGFPARLILVSAEGRSAPVIPDDEPEGERNRSDAVKPCIDTLTRIRNMKGRLRMTPAARALLRDFAAEKRSSPPVHPKLRTYVTRRWFHLAKLGMVVYASNGGTGEIDADTLEQAEEILTRAEKTMADALVGIGDNPLKGQMDAAYRIIKDRWAKSRQGVPEHVIMHVLYDDVHPAAWKYALDGLVDAGMVTDIEGVLFPGDVLGELEQ